MADRDRDIKRNRDGYHDPTPYPALKKIDSRRRTVGKLIKTIYNVAHLAGCRVEQIIILDEETGQEYTE